MGGERQKGERKRLFQRRWTDISPCYFRQIGSGISPVASLALGLEEQVVALVGGGGEVEFV